MKSHLRTKIQNPYLAYYTMDELRAIALQNNISTHYPQGTMQGRAKTKKNLYMELKDILHQIPITKEDIANRLEEQELTVKLAAMERQEVFKEQWLKKCSAFK